MPYLVRCQDQPDRDVLPRRHFIGRLDTHLDDRTLRPFITNLRNWKFTLQPLLRETALAFRSLQMQEVRHHVIRGEKAMAAVLAVAGIAIVVR